jgi:hypothetical protein
MLSNEALKIRCKKDYDLGGMYYNSKYKMRF